MSDGMANRSRRGGGGQGSRSGVGGSDDGGGREVLSSPSLLQQRRCQGRWADLLLNLLYYVIEKVKATKST